MSQPLPQDVSQTVRGVADRNTAIQKSASRTQTNRFVRRSTSSSFSRRRGGRASPFTASSGGGKRSRSPSGSSLSRPFRLRRLMKPFRAIANAYAFTVPTCKSSRLPNSRINVSETMSSASVKSPKASLRIGRRRRSRLDKSLRSSPSAAPSRLRSSLGKVTSIARKLTVPSGSARIEYQPLASFHITRRRHDLWRKSPIAHVAPRCSSNGLACIFNGMDRQGGDRGGRRDQ